MNKILLLARPPLCAKIDKGLILRALAQMVGKAKPGGRRKQIAVIPTPKAAQQRLEKHSEESKPDLNSIQAVVRIAEESSFVHFYLACGHLITIGKADLKGARPHEMDCWACTVSRHL